MAKPEKVKGEPKAVTPWRPHSEIARMEREMDRMFEDFLAPDGIRFSDELFRDCRDLP